MKTFKISVEHQFTQTAKETKTIKTNTSLTQVKVTLIEIVVRFENAIAYTIYPYPRTQRSNGTR